MNIILKALPLILLVGSAGCLNENKSKNSSYQLISTNWNFLGTEQYENKIYEPLPNEVPGMNIVFNASHTFQASSSCNTVYGNYTVIKPNSLKMDSIVMTKMFCMDSILIVWEDRYISGLKSTEGFTITNDTLVIKTASIGGMIFKAQPGKN